MVVADTVDEIVDLANESTYSLSAGIWKRDIHTALDVTSRVHSGVYKTAPLFHVFKLSSSGLANINGGTFHGESLLGHGGLG